VDLLGGGFGNGVGVLVDFGVEADVGVGCGAAVVVGGDEDLFEGDVSDGVDPDGDVGEGGFDGGVFGDEVEFFGFDAVDGFGALVGDGPCLGEGLAAAAEAEGEEAFVFGLVVAGFEDVDGVGTGGVDLEEVAVEGDDFGGGFGGFAVGAEVEEEGAEGDAGFAGALDEDGAGFDVVGADDAGVVVVGDVGLGAVEGLAGCVHLFEDGVKGGLRVGGGGEGEEEDWEFHGQFH
jgi:hypothetical protein